MPVQMHALAAQTRILHKPRGLATTTGAPRANLSPVYTNDLRSLLPSVWVGRFEAAEDPFLGSGACAKIFKILDQGSKEAFALKVIDRSFYARRRMEAQIALEIKALRECEKRGLCRHVIRLMDALDDGPHIFIRMELCKGSLARVLRERGGRLKEAEGMELATQLFSGLRDLHAIGILHRDIKPDNLLLATDGQTLKIADLGWCAEIRDLPTNTAGTFTYMAPEILDESGRVQTEAADVWSGGATLFELVMGRPFLSVPADTGLSRSDPRRANTFRMRALLLRIADTLPLLDNDRPCYLTPRCWASLQAMLVMEVADRGPVSLALEHLAGGRLAQTEPRPHAVTLSTAPALTKTPVSEASTASGSSEGSTKPVPSALPHPLLGSICVHSPQWKEQHRGEPLAAVGASAAKLKAASPQASAPVPEAEPRGARTLGEAASPPTPARRSAQVRAPQPCQACTLSSPTGRAQVTEEQPAGSPTRAKASGAKAAGEPARPETAQRTRPAVFQECSSRARSAMASQPAAARPAPWGGAVAMPPGSTPSTPRPRLAMLPGPRPAAGRRL